MKFDRAEETLEAVAAQDWEAGLFEVRKGDPILFLKRITYEENGKPVEYVGHFGEVINCLLPF